MNSRTRPSPSGASIKPFLDDLTESKAGSEGSIFVVGDIKQSVYQWRGGDPELFRSVSTQLQLEERGMSTSYRSVQPVLDLVNDICDYARTAPDCEPAALEQWGEYPEHRCAPHLEGRVRASPKSGRRPRRKPPPPTTWCARRQPTS